MLFDGGLNPGLYVCPPDPVIYLPIPKATPTIHITIVVRVLHHFLGMSY